MSQPLDTLAVNARSHNERQTSDSINNHLGTPSHSTAGSSVFSTGSFLDLYTQSSNPDPSHADVSPIHQPQSATSLSPIPGLPPPLPARSLSKPSSPLLPFTITLSADWTKHILSPDPISTEKRGSSAGLDADMLSSIQPAHHSDLSSNDFTHASYAASESNASHYDDDNDEQDHLGLNYGDNADVNVSDRAGRTVSHSVVNQNRTSHSRHKVKPNLTIISTPSDNQIDPSNEPLTGKSIYTAAQSTLTSNSIDSDLTNYSNNFPSPPVPQRTSSVNPSPSIHSTLGSAWQSPLVDNRIDQVDQLLAKQSYQQPPSASLIPNRWSSTENQKSPTNRWTSATPNPAPDLKEKEEMSSGLGIYSSDTPLPTKTFASENQPLDRNSAKHRRDATTAADGGIMSPAESAHPRFSAQSQNRPSPTERPSDSPVKLESDQTASDSRSSSSNLRALSPDNKRFSQHSSTLDEPNLEEQKMLEQQLLLDEEASDSARPRTLQEARDKARLRRQQSEAAAVAATSANTNAVLDSPFTGQTSQFQGSQLDGNVQPSAPRSSTESIGRPTRDPRRALARQSNDFERGVSMSDESAPSDYSHSSPAGYDTDDDRERYTDPNKPTEHRENYHLADSDSYPGGIEGLTAAVSSVMAEMSFVSATDLLEIEDSPKAPLGLPRSPQVQVSIEPFAPSSNTDNSQLVDPDTPRQSGTRRFDSSAKALDSPYSASVNSNLHTAVPSRTSSARNAEAIGFHPASVTDSPVTPKANPATKNNLQRVRMTPASSQPLLASIQANKPIDAAYPTPITQIEIYGRTVPLPRSFMSSSIIVGKKKAAAWERAKSYAQYANELLAVETGLALWVEVVQRPAMRQQSLRVPNHDAHGARSGHVRNEASYASSVRSDMTFPMRGDGGRAKENVSTLPTMSESPPSKLPSNLPYPALAEQRSNSAASFMSASTSQASIPNRSSTMSHESATSVENGFKGTILGSNTRAMGPSGFFSSLGRKGSRRTPGSGSVSSIGQSGLASIANVVVGGPRANRAKGKTISAPMHPAGERPSTEVDVSGSPDNSAALYALPRAPGTADGTSLSTGARLATVTETPAYANQTIAANSNPTAVRSPMGPRAPGQPNSLGRNSGSEVYRAGSAASQNSTAAAAANNAFTSYKLTNSSQMLVSSPMSITPGRDDNGRTSQQSWRESDKNSPSLAPPKDGTFSSVRSSFSYGTVKEKLRGNSPNDSSSHDQGFQEALNKLSDVLPDADTATLSYYLRKAKGNDIVAIGDYLEDQSIGKLR